MYVKDQYHKSSFFCDCGHNGDQLVVSYFDDEDDVSQEFTYVDLVIPPMNMWHRLCAAARYVFRPGYILHQEVILNRKETTRLRDYLDTRLSYIGDKDED